LDSDVLVFSNINLGKIAFHGFPIAAVYDIAEMGGFTDPKFNENVRRNGISAHYFNSGVMAFDSKLWKDVDLKYSYDSEVDKHFDHCDYKRFCTTADQCVFNKIFSDNWRRLPLSLNMQACAMFCERWADAPIRHYVGARKFFPVRSGRNDARDLAAINDARALLELEPVGLPSPEISYRINKARHAAWSKKVSAVMESLELMSVSVQ
jgi:lipopolysaccharide biosynthesis glycosyltransferase